MMYTIMEVSIMGIVYVGTITTYGNKSYDQCYQSAAFNFLAIYSILLAQVYGLRIKMK